MEDCCWFTGVGDRITTGERRKNAVVGRWFWSIGVCRRGRGRSGGCSVLFGRWWVLTEYGGAVPVGFVGGEKRSCGVVSPEVMVMRVSPEISEGGGGAGCVWEIKVLFGRRWPAMGREG
ncbi:hypothetical protein HAX54_024031 [Datura stramonium]|uniref:Uncharacterized protein n=1 Tax=Datura stramonium TaxID=4076 RepID=A0ABS8UYR3_DATST|nr:hypothetical protein [Datura stramonium]